MLPSVLLEEPDDLLDALCVRMQDEEQAQEAEAKQREEANVRADLRKKLGGLA